MWVGGGGGHAYGAHMLYGRRIAGSGLMPAAFPFAGRVTPRFFFRIKGVPAIPQRCYFYASRVPLNGRRSIRATTASTASSSNSGGWGTEAKREGWVKLTPEQIAEYERAQEEATLQPHNEPEEGEEQEEQEEEEEDEEEEEEEEDEEEWNNWEEDEEEDEEEEVEDEEWGVRDDEDDKTEEQNGDKDSLTGEQEEMLTAKHEWSPEDRDIPLFARKIRQHLRRHNPEVFQEIERIGEEAAPQTEDEEKEKEGEEEEVTKTHKFFQQHTVSKNEAGMRLDRWLREKFPELPLTLFQRLLRKKKITINSDFRIEKYVYKPYEENKALKGHKVEGSYHIALGDVIILPSSLFSEELHQQKLREGQAAKQNRVMIPLTEGEIQLVKSWVLYQDDRIIAINKPPGLPVQGGTDITEYYLDRFLPALQDDYEDPPRLVHRLDKECSGVLLLGRTRKDADYLAKLFRNKKLLRKEYWAVCAGVPNAKQGRLETPLIKAGKKMIALEAMEKGAKMAVSRYKLLESAGPELSFLALYPWTGRKHQLRVQCASVLKTPILGDTKYAHNDEDKFSLILGKIEKLHLHCRSIELPHPQKKNARLRIFASPPPHMMHTLKEFDWTEAVPKQLSLQSRLAT